MTAHRAIPVFLVVFSLFSASRVLAQGDPVTGQIVTTSADVSVTQTDNPDQGTAGAHLTYTITVTNAGPDNADMVVLSDTVGGGTTFVSLSQPGGWSCSTPTVGGDGAINCSIASLAPGTYAVFTLTVQSDPSLTNVTVITNTATVASLTVDPSSANNSDTETTTLYISGDVMVLQTDSPDPVTAGTNLTYTITVTDAGPSDAQEVTLDDTVPTGTTFVSMTQPDGWSCTTPAAGATGPVHCSIATLAADDVAELTLVVNVDPSLPNGTVIATTAYVASSTPGLTWATKSALETTIVQSPARVTGTKSVTGSFVPSGDVSYTIVLTNDGSLAQPDNPGDELTDILSSQLVLVSATATSGTAVANVGTNTVRWNGSIAASALVTITINATIRPDTPVGSTISNQATIHYDAEGNGTNESSRTTDSPLTPGAADPTTFVIGEAHLAKIPTLDELALLALAIMLAMMALLVMEKSYDE
jgi:large repetitive protein